MLLGIIALLLAGVIGGAISPTFVKLGVSQIPPILFTGLRFLVALVVFLPFFLTIKGKKFNKKSIRDLSILSVFFILNVLLFSFAIQRTTVIMSQILYALVPVIVAFLSLIFLKEKIKNNQLVGGAVALMGLSLLIFQSIQKQEFLTFGTILGNILVLGGVFSWSSYLTYSKKLSNIYSAKVISFYNFLATTVVMLAISPTESGQSIHINNVSLISILVTGIVSSAIFIFLIQFGIKKTSVITAALFNYTAPFFAGIAGILVFGEKITSTLIVGGLLIIIGVFYASTLPLFRKYRSRKK